MNIRKIEFDLDFSTLGNIDSVGSTKQGDVELVQFVITLQNYDKDFLIDKNSQFIMYGTKKDGTKICNSCEINEENKIIYTLHSQDTAVSGLVHYQLVISSVIDGIVKELVSPKFSFCVGNKMINPEYKLLETEPEDWEENYNSYFRLTDGFYSKLNEKQAPVFDEGTYYFCNGIIESSDEFGALTSALHKAEEFAKKCDSLDEQVTEAVTEYFEENPSEKGENGDSAYKVAVNNGYKGSEEEWLESLKGTDGVGIEHAEVTGKGELILDLSNNETVHCGYVVGADGKDGLNGKDGVSVTNAYILPPTAGSEAGKLVIEFSNGEGMILDKVVGADGKDGKDGTNGVNGTNGADGKDGYTPVKGIDYFTESDKAEMVEQVTTQISSESIPDYWVEHLNSKIAEIKKLQQLGGRNSFSFVVMTDMHYESNLAKFAPTLAKKIMDECGIKFCLCLGDTATRHGANHNEAYVDNEWAEIEKMFEPIRDRLLITQGNHDGSYGIIDLNNDGVADDINDDNKIDSIDKNVYNWTPQKLYENIFRKVSTIDNVNFSSDGMGYYVDDTGSRVRYILLNTHVNKWEQNEDGSMKYNNMYNFRFGQSQYDMVIEALQSVPTDDWSVVIGSHVPLDRSAEYTSWGGEEDENGALIETSVTGSTVMQRMLNAYYNKTSYSGRFRGTQGSDNGYTNYALVTSDDWWEDSRFDSSGNQASSTGYDVTNYIPCKNGDIIRLKNATIAEANRFVLYDANKNRLSLWNGTNFENTYTTEADGTIVLDATSLISNEDNSSSVAYIRLPVKIDDDIAPIITVNEEITESSTNFDAVSVNVDFTEAKGQLIAYFGGHIHSDKALSPIYEFKGSEHSDFYIITTRSDGRVENSSDLHSERIAGTITEQSFDVFTINKNERRIYATKIGAGTDRGKDTAITY